MKRFLNTKIAKFLFLPNLIIFSEIKVNNLPLFTDMKRIIFLVYTHEVISRAPPRTSSKV